MLKIGLTGSIGMGKSTTAAMFARRGIPVFDADATVHALYEGPLVADIEAAFPGCSVDGRVERSRLAAAVTGDPAALARLEGLVHPAVRAAEAAFIAKAESAGARCVLFDIPLLFETGRDGDMDHTVVVSAPAAVQRARVLARPGMSEERLAAILARQWPDARKRQAADYIVETGDGLAAAEAAVDRILGEIGRG